jgi:hypothetical protein
MRLAWDRPGVVRATLKVEELAALVAGARMAAAALAGQSAEQAEALDRVLATFDRAVTHLGPVPSQPERSGTGATVSSATG